jgi:putative transposase
MTLLAFVTQKMRFLNHAEIFYNRQRKRARLGYLSPAAFTQKFYNSQLAA